MLSRGRFAVKVVVLEGPLDNYSLQELKAIFVHFRVFSFFVFFFCFFFFSLFFFFFVFFFFFFFFFFFVSCLV